MDYTIKPMVTTKKIVGPAMTINVPIGEGGSIADSIPFIKDGDVIVISGKGNCNSSYWGDHRSICANMLKAEGVACGTALKSGKGELNTSVSCGGIVVNAGDIIVGDRNGVIAIQPEKVAETIERSKAKIEAQRITVEQMMKTGEVMPKVI